MAFRFEERPTSRRSSGNPPSTTLIFFASGTTDKEFVESYAYGFTPALWASTWGILYRQNIEVNPEASDHYEVVVTYGPGQKFEEGQFSFSFDTSGGQLHVKTSRETINKYPPSATDYKQCIGVRDSNGTADVDGCDIIIPALKINVSFVHPTGVVTLPYMKTLARNTGKVNSDTFLTFAPGEILFMGAQGSQGTEQKTTINYSFLASENATGLTIASIGDIAKDGHDVLWVKWEKDNAADSAAVTPAMVYIERVYERTSLAGLLGFGG